jgi:cytochrome P450
MPINPIPKPPLHEYLNWLALFKRDGIRFMDKGFAKFGPLFGMRMGVLRPHWTNDYETMTSLLKDEFTHLSKRPFYDNLESLLGKGLINSEGEEWKQKRAVAQPSFAMVAVRSYVDKIYSNTVARIEALPKLRTAPFDDSEYLRTIVLENMLLTALDPEASYTDEQLLIEQEILQIQDYLSRNLEFPFPFLKHLPSVKRRNYKASLKRLDGLILNLIKNVKSKNGLIYKMTTKHVNEELVGQVKTMFFAGYETTAATLTFMVHLLSLHPEWLEKVKAEIHETFGSDGFNYAGLEKLENTRMVLNETLRLYPAIWVISRSALHDMKVMDFDLQKGEMIVFSLYHIHRNPKYWENPNEFQPQRFAGKDTANMPGFAPFITGRRSCIGRFFAIYEILTMLVALLQRGTPKANEHAVRFKAQITLRPSVRPFSIEMH